MAEMTGRDYYIQNGYDELPEAVRAEMRRVFDTGVNNSGVWVRYKEVENLAGVMAYQYTHRPVATNADRIRAMSDKEMMEYMYHNCHCPPELDELPSCPYRKKNRVQTKDCRTCWLDWLKREVEDG